MAVVSDITGAYASPKRAMRRQIQAGIEEPQTLFFALCYGFLSFVSLLPALAQRAIVQDLELSALAGAQFIASVFMMPLLMYGIAGISHWILARFGGQGSYVAARRALFWAGLVAVPLLLLSSALSVFIPEMRVFGAIVTAMVFFWQWISCLIEVEYPNV
ncbi:hypothetical protein GCM10007939_05350 [Amylibacter marinus]|uniref:Yip1 domain-containing protein n=1 Tax=Amylibacter marinus TaxID=1475483 RepID=A0ABQ5VSL5_9RHOB|nr:YIP1 family protein [Amylibacter marinus]GLQ34252.1 hypothetical protein GCM10007939_05350 [Amylibacter marinus]